jgi:hypothetical protein
MIGDTVVAPHRRPALGLCKVVAASYNMSADGNFSGTVDVIPTGEDDVYTLDVNEVRILFFSTEARTRFTFDEEPDIVY